jgi:hypothetical protein
MSLRNTPNRNNSKDIDKRIAMNQSKPCKLKNCDAHRYGLTGYCNIHDSRYNTYGDPYQIPLRLCDDFALYYKATLAYIENHQDELSEYLDYVEKLIQYPDFIKYHDVTGLQKWNAITDYRNKNLPIALKPMDILRRWKKDTRSPKQYLASVIAPHVYHYQEPEVLLGGKPVHMMVTRSLLSQCSTEHTRELIPYHINKRVEFKKIIHTNRVGTRDRTNLGLRLTSIFTQAIAMVYKEIPKVVDEGAKEHRKKLEHYKMLEKMYKEGDSRFTEVDLERARVKLGL